MGATASDQQHLILPVLLAGGSGTRLWPLSTEAKPKPFLRLTGDRTLFQQTLGRLDGWEVQPPLIVCGDQHKALVAEQTCEIGCNDVKIIAEPYPRNTAPAIALAALHASVGGRDPLLLVMPCDHHIADSGRFRSAVAAAIPLALDGGLVTLGVKCTRPETGYGYILCGAPMGNGGFKIEAFVEKPDIELAGHFVADGRYVWNSGMFLFRASSIVGELDRFHPDIMDVCRRAVTHSDNGAIVVDAEAFAHCPSISLDRAVMESTAKGRMVRLDAGWSDIGSWDALRLLGVPDAQGNICQGTVTLSDSTGNHVHASARQVVLIGVNDLVVVETADGVLVVSRERAHEIGRMATVVQRDDDGVKPKPRNQKRRLSIKT